MSTDGFSVSSRAAIEHLRRLKPLDGWALESPPSTAAGGTAGVQLKRRNVPVSGVVYLHLHVLADGRVVGVLSEQGGSATAQVLVDGGGRLLPPGKVEMVTIKDWSRSTRNVAASSSPSSSDSAVSPEVNHQILLFAGYVIAGAFVLKFIVAVLSSLWVLALPALYVYGIATCPAEASFDAKQQLKRVLRGHHLPEEHPDKPRGLLSEALARLQATVATELSTSLGYDVTAVSLAGAALVMCVRVPSIERDFYWVGTNHQWYYMYSTSLSPSSDAASAAARHVSHRQSKAS